MRRFRGLLAGGLIAACGVAAMADPLDDQIKDYYDTTAYTIDDLALPGEVPQAGFDVVATIGGQDYVLSLDPVSLRSENFRVLIDDGTQLREVPAPAPRTVRGQIEGVPGSLVVGSLMPDGLSVMIELPVNGEIQKWFIQPLHEVDPTQDPAHHVVYFSEDQVWPEGAHCPVDAGLLHKHDQEVSGDINPANPLYQCEIAFDLDNDYYNARGQDQNALIADLETVMNVVDVTYERDCEITYLTTDIIIRTSRTYTTTDSSALLTQFQSRWNSNHGNIQRDIAHLMTGKNLNGGVIGIAYLSVICNRSQGYGLSETTFSGSLNFRAALTAHELGHNWSAQHCDGQTCNIMCSFINGCNGIGNPIRFATVSINRIVSFRNSRNCLDIVNDNTLPLPFFDDVPSSVIDEVLWPVEGRNGVGTGFVGGEPSPPWALVIDATDHITTAPLLAGGASNVVMSFYAAQIQVEACKALVVEYLNEGQNTYTEFGRITSDGNILLPYQQFGFLVPQAALYDGVQFRIRAEGTDDSDDWYVDDVLIEANGVIPPPPSISLPWFESFPCDQFSPNSWGDISGAQVSSAGVGEPSSPYSMEISGLDRADTLAMNASSYGMSPLYLHFWMEERNLEAGDAILIQYFDAGNTVQTLGVLVSSGGTQNSYTLYEFELPQNAMHDNLRIRFQGSGGNADDTWYIDDIGVDENQLIGDDCPADVDGNGTLDGNDFFAFLDLFAAEDPAADIDGNGTIDGNDFFAYLDLFAAGCP